MRARPLGLVLCLVLACAPPEGEPPPPLAPAEAPAPESATPSQAPVSAIQALTHVLDSVERSTAPGVEPVVSRIDAHPGEDPSEIDVGLDLAVLADDALEATRAFGELTDTLEVAPWSLGVTWRRSEPLSDPPGIHVDRLTVRVRLDSRPVPVSDTDAPYRIRSLAQREGVELGALDVDFKEEPPMLEHYPFRPHERRTAFDLDRILLFLRDLDDEGAGLVVTRANVQPTGRVRPGERPAPDAWTFEGRLTRRAGG